MAVHTLQFTIPTGGGPVQISTLAREIRCIIFQNNSGHAMRIGGQTGGDTTLSSTVGYNLAASGGSLTVGTVESYFAYINQFQVVGTAADVLDVLYIT
jgi:hypothetical protein